MLAPEQAEQARYVSARLVQIVARERGSFDGRWLDVGCGNGSLVATAAEFGYLACGLDTRQEPVDRCVDRRSGCSHSPH